MISALVFLVAGVVLLFAPETGRRRRPVRNADEGIWVERRLKA